MDPSSVETPKAGKFKADVEHKRKTGTFYQSGSQKMKSLLMNSAAIRSSLRQEADTSVNPIWVNFPTRCVRSVKSADEMRALLEHHSHSEDVMLVRYHQANCTACNALDKTYEFLCHQSQSRFTKIHFFEVSKDETPELTKGLVRFPQIKGFSGGQWVDLDFKPPTEFRDMLYKGVEKEVRGAQLRGTPITAQQAEEMYFSAAGPAMLSVTEESISNFYAKTQARLHNYWRQVSVRRSWFYKKFVEPQLDDKIQEDWRLRSVLGEKIVYGPEPMDVQ